MNLIEKHKGPCIILAGAGTGKTYNIVKKVKHLIENKIYQPDKIVCITFSNEAANNLSARIEKEVNLTKERPIIRTFHGFSADLLRKHGNRIGLNKEFRILDPEQAMVLIHRSLRTPALNCRRYIETIGTVKDLGIKMEDFQKYIEMEGKKINSENPQQKLENLQFEFQTLHLREKDFQRKEILIQIKRLKSYLDMKKFVCIWNAYEKIKKIGNYQDYSDLNNNTLLLLERQPDIANDFEYFIVDEFQDTNKIQLDFLIKIASHGNITVVGDLNQSIYRFRGAYRENMSIFKKFFDIGKKDIFNLDKSYRSSNKILRAAHQLIQNNYLNKEECFFVQNAHNREGENAKIYELVNAKEETRKIVEIVKEEIARGTPPEEICIIFRAHQHGRIIKRGLEQAGIKYFSASKTSLFKQKSIKTSINYLKIANRMKKNEKYGEQEWWDLVYMLDFSNEDLIKIGKMIKVFKKKIIDEGFEKEKTISQFLLKELLNAELSEKGKILSRSIVEKISLLVKSADKPISEFIQEVYRISGLINGQKTLEEKEAMLNMNKFFELAKTHEELYDSDLGNFLFYLSILENLEINIPAASLEESGIRMMTSHATKGLEYKVVVITNMVQGRFPIEKYIGNPLIPMELMPEIKEKVSYFSDEEKEQFVKDYEKRHQILEERRLAYVSFTRAKERLILTFAKEYGGKKFFPSQFLNEINFRSNNDIDFELDDEKKFVEPELKLQPVQNNIPKLDCPDGIEQVALSREVKNEHVRFSPSALMLFDSCQKEFEYKYVFNMPERKTFSWEAMRLGSFVHFVLEKGVSLNIKKFEKFFALAKEMSLDEDWKGIAISEAETLIRVFFERNKDKYNENSKTEQYLPLSLEGLEFIGFADRIDFDSSGEAEIVDYKTGKGVIAPKDREWQLGFYALAAEKKYGRVKRVTLDMLKQEKPLEFEIDGNGNARCRSSEWIKSFNIYEVEHQLVETARKIQYAYKSGFKPCSIEKNCDFCNEYVYQM